MLREFFVNLKKGTEYLNYGREILRSWGSRHILGGEGEEFSILDIGCGHGTDLLNIREEVRKNAGGDRVCNLTGIENYEPYVRECRDAGIEIHSLDIERERFPGEEGSFDLVLANQVLEHTKEIFWITSEAARLLKPGGLFLVGVPNLASLHNRILLCFGKQPTAIQAYSAHVRGFTASDFRTFSEQGGFFRLTEVRGSNFYPFGPSLSKPLSRLFPKMAWGIFFRLERTDKKGSFLECLGGEENLLETPFYGSPQNPVAVAPPDRKYLTGPASSSSPKSKSSAARSSASGSSAAKKGAKRGGGATGAGGTAKKGRSVTKSTTGEKK